ncbi:MAG TPA: class I SAM-dependent methyltransferase [Candidatus Dormibacteraeota bacterium]|nr:class I SAM-dependent methyltransferase [Candidatus Dormibacteraeota bacterium]
MAKPTGTEIWDRWAKTDPLWAILSWDGKQDAWKWEDFMATGRDDVARFLKFIHDLGLPLRPERALDFGCGVGRLSRALAETFAHVEGVDASTDLIRLAIAHNDRPGRIAFRVNDLTLPFPNEYFDLVFSWLVLQHIPPGEQLRYLAEFARVVRPGGLLAFQFYGFPVRFRGRVGAALPRPLMALYRTLRYQARRTDVYSLHPDRVRTHLAKFDVSIAGERREHDHRGAYASYYFVAQKLLHDP